MAPTQSAAPPTRAKTDKQALTALLQNEVVDTKTGEIAWAGEFSGYTRKGLGDRVRLLETFIKTALH